MTTSNSIGNNHKVALGNDHKVKFLVSIYCNYVFLKNIAQHYF